MGARGPKPWEPSDEELKAVRLHAGLGATQENVARLLGKSVDTIVRTVSAKTAFELGKAETVSKVAGSLVRKALGGDTASAIFYLKTQAGWKETVRQEHSGPDGGAIPLTMSDADLERIAAGK